MSRLVVLILFVASVGCASRPPAVEAIAASPGEQWERLAQHARAAEGRRAYSRLQWEGGGRRVGFDATLVTDAGGTLRLEALTPVGTAAATLWTDGRELVFLNHRNDTWWNGSIDEIPDASPLVPALRAIGIDAASNLLFGIPVSGEATPCRSDFAVAECRAVGDVIHEVTASGLLRVSMPGVVIDYETPSVPATRVRIDAASGILSVMHRAIESSVEPVERPVPPASWRCCVLPGFE